MELLPAFAIIEDHILSGTKHQDYERVCLLAQRYKALITGENAGLLLERFVKREDDEMFDQRVRLTQLITPSLCASVQTPFSRVARNEHITKRVDVKNDEKLAAVQTMLNEFYGAGLDENGLDSWLRTRFVELTFSDPNAWMVVVWADFDNLNEYPSPRPLEIKAHEAIDFSINNQVVEWLLVANATAYDKVRKGAKMPVGSSLSDPSAPYDPALPYNMQFTAEQRNKYFENAEAYRYTMYTDTAAIVYTPVDPRAVDMTAYAAGSELVTLDSKRRNDTSFVRSVFDYGFTYVPAVRIGYKRDVFTDARTFVNPFHSAMPFLMKSVKTVSELDLTMAQHAFPQKFQYIQRCKGSNDKPCNDGFCMDGSKCAVCGGTGWKIPSSAQDAIVLPLPTDPNEVYDLSKLAWYLSPPADLITFQSQYVDSFSEKVHRAVFNSGVFMQPTIAKTATEKELDMDSAYDALYPFAGKYSSIYKFVARTCIALADVPVDQTQVLHKFPSDFKLKTIPMLVSQLQQLNDSGAPAFVKSAVTDDLAELVYVDDSVGYLKYKTQKTFFPFAGKNEAQIEFIMDTDYVTSYNKVLFANFESIFSQIEREQKDFYLLNYDEQKAIIDKHVEDLQSELQQQAAVQFAQQAAQFAQQQQSKQQSQQGNNG